MKLKHLTGLLLLLFIFNGCVSVPRESVDLSAQLGKQIDNIKLAHKNLLELYINEKKDRINEFIDSEWTPKFVDNFFKDSEVSADWQEVIQSQDNDKRNKFIIDITKALQGEIAKQRTLCLKPIETLKMGLHSKLDSAYSNAEVMNNGITSYLISAADLSEQSKNIFSFTGISESKIDNYMMKANNILSTFLLDAGKAKNIATEVKTYEDKIKELFSK